MDHAGKLAFTRVPGAPRWCVRTLIIALACLVGRVPTVRAQITIEVGPRFGLFGAGNHLIEQPVSGGSDCSPETSTLEYGQQSTLALGADLSAWLADRWALVFTTSYVGSDVVARDVGPPCLPVGFDLARPSRALLSAVRRQIASTFAERTPAACNVQCDAHLWFAGARILRAFPIAQGPLSWDLSLGIGYASRGGAFYNGFTGTNTFTGLAAVGLRLKTSPWTALRADFEDNISSVRLVTPSTTLAGYSPAPGSQNDWIFSFGFALNVGGRLKGPFF